MFDYSKLRGLVRTKLGTEGALAERIGRTKTYMSHVFSGKSMLTQKDIWAISEVLGISAEEIGIYFFTEKVS